MMSDHTLFSEETKVYQWKFIKTYLHYRHQDGQHTGVDLEHCGYFRGDQRQVLARPDDVRVALTAS